MTIQRPSLPVQWHEGMLLSPQHFQQDAIHQATESALKAYLSEPMSWGVERLAFDNALLGGGRIRVLSLRAVFPDGTPVWYEAEEDPPLELDAADALSQTTDEPSADSAGRRVRGPSGSVPISPRATGSRPCLRGYAD